MGKAGRTHVQTYYDRKIEMDTLEELFKAFLKIGFRIRLIRESTHHDKRKNKEFRGPAK